jgi:hypothetical protein
MEQCDISPLRGYRTAREWCEQSGGAVFPTHESFSWFVRQHREELMRTRQYLPRRGSAGALVGPRIDEVVERILHRECCGVSDVRAAQDDR